MSENKDNKLTLINEKTANDYLTHTFQKSVWRLGRHFDIMDGVQCKNNERNMGYGYQPKTDRRA